MMPEELLTLACQYGDAIYPYPDGEPVCSVQFTTVELSAFAAAIEAATIERMAVELKRHGWDESAAFIRALAKEGA